MFGVPSPPLACQVYAVVCLSILHLCCLSVTFAVQISIVEGTIQNLPRCPGMGCAGAISKPSGYWCYPASLSVFSHVGTSVAVVSSRRLE